MRHPRRALVEDVAPRPTLAAAGCAPTRPTPTAVESARARDRKLPASVPALAPVLALGLVLAAGAAACGKAPTSLLLTVSRASKAPRPDGLEVRVLDPHGLLVTTRVPDLGRPAVSLPGTIKIDLAPTSERVAVVVAGVKPNDASGVPLAWGWTSWITVAKDKQLAAAVELATSFPDRDMDNVPDDLDNCPDAFNADQRSSDGKIGDRCRPGGGDAGAGDGGADAGDAAAGGDAPAGGDGPAADDGPAGGDKPPGDAPAGGDRADGPGGGRDGGGEAAADADSCTLFADGFETGTLAAWTPTGAVSVVMGGALEGMYAAHAAPTGSGAPVDS